MTGFWRRGSFEGGRPATFTAPQRECTLMTTTTVFQSGWTFHLAKSLLERWLQRLTENFNLKDKRSNVKNDLGHTVKPKEAAIFNRWHHVNTHQTDHSIDHSIHHPCKFSNSNMEVFQHSSLQIYNVKNIIHILSYTKYAYACYFIPKTNKTKG